MIPSKRAARQHWFLAAAGLVLSAITARGMVLVREHQPAATIVVDRGASAQVQAAAKTLQAYVQKSTGALLPIADRPGDGVALHVGVTEFVRTHDPRGQALDDDGFVLDGTTPGNFVIVGGSDWGTEFGVYDFLERYLDVAWLMPTALGEDVPKRATLEVPDQRRRDEPVYLSRQLSPLDIDDSGINMTVRAIDPFYVGENSPNRANNRWGRFNRARGRIAFHHNLVELFAPSVFANDHPEFYPFIDGKRQVPPAVAGYVIPRWQPNFSAPGIVDAAAGRIEEYFRAHPNVSSYSLGTNDNHGFDQSPASLARRNGLKNYTGVQSVSDDYFLWADSVADKVLAHYPDKWFGMLAYEGIAEPPTRVKVHPRIVPFITYDRMRWGDPKLREFGEHLTEQWAEKSPALGWYDYTYGAQYLVPRVWFHQMQEYLAWGAAHHVKFHYAELYPSWGEGPKPWLFTKLLWNPNQDVDQLLDVWYRHAAGPAGAAKLREFYSVWEGFWAKDVYSTHWNTGTGHYLPFSNPSYLLEVPEAYVARADRLMQEALAASDTPEHRARVGKLAELWGFYKVSYEAYRGLVNGDQAPTASEDEICSLLDHAKKVIVLAHHRQDLIQKFGDDPLNALVAHAVGYLYRYPLLGARWGSGLLWKAEPWVTRSPRIKARLEELAHDPDSVVRSSAQLVLDAAGDQVRGPVANPSFDQGLADWSVSGMKENSGSGFKVEAAPHGLTVSGPGGGSVSQTIAYVPGDYYAVVECQSPSGLPHGKATLGLVALNPAGGTERGPDGRRFYLPSAPVVFRLGESNVLALSFRLPPAEGKVVQVKLSITFADLGTEDKILLDHLDIYRENTP